MVSGHTLIGLCNNFIFQNHIRNLFICSNRIPDPVRIICVEFLLYLIQICSTIVNIICQLDQLAILIFSDIGHHAFTGVFVVKQVLQICRNRRYRKDFFTNRIRQLALTCTSTVCVIGNTAVIRNHLCQVLCRAFGANLIGSKNRLDTPNGKL